MLRATAIRSAATARQSPHPAGEETGRPRHVAIIMDGNGRWAQRRHMPRLEGHRQGVDNIRRIVPAAIDLGIQVLTLMRSPPKTGRPRDEVSGLMRLFTLISRRETENLHRQGVQVHHIGSLEGVGARLARAIEDAVVITRNTPCASISRLTTAAAPRSYRPCRRSCAGVRGGRCDRGVDHHICIRNRVLTRT